MADRYCVMGQIYIEDVDSGIDISGRKVADSAFTCAGAGTFKVYMANGTTGTVAGTNVQGTPVTLSAGENTITTTGAVADGVIDITIGTAANTNSVNSLAASSGGQCGASLTTSADNLYADSNSFTAGSQVLTVDETSFCKDMDWTGSTNNPTLNTNKTLLVYRNVTTIAAMALTGSYGVALYGASSTITTNGLTWGTSLTCYASGGLWTLADNFNSSSNIYLYRGTLATANFSITCGGFTDIGAAEVKTLTPGTSTISCTSWSFPNANFTLTANTATINISGVGACALGNANYNGASFNLIGTAHVVSGNPTGIATFTRTGTATKTDTVTFTSGNTLTCTTFAMIGNSATNRLLVQSSTLGSPATITATNWTGTDKADFMDITSTNAADLSGCAGYSGDCGGNTNITFTTPAAQTSSKASTWADATMWTSRVPLPQDDVSCGHNVTVDMPRIGKSVEFTGTITVTKSNAIWVFGSFTIGANVTYANSGATYEYMAGRGSYTLTPNSAVMRLLFLWCPGGTYTLGSNLNHSASYTMQLSYGTLTCGSYTINTYYFSAQGSATINMNSSIWNILANDATTKWNMGAATTLNAGTSTINLTNASSNGQTFVGGGKTYNNVTVSGAGNYALRITGNNIFGTFTVDRSQAAKTITGTAGSTQTVADFVCADSGSTVLTLNSTGAAWTLAKSGGGKIHLKYLSIDNVVASPFYTWYYDDNTVVGANVIGWNYIKTQPFGNRKRHRLISLVR